MKKISHISFLNVAILALAVLVFGAIGSKTFALSDAQYTTNFTPNGCDTSLMTVYHTPSTFSGGLLASYKIYVVSGNYTISSNIEMVNCSTIVVNSDSTGATFTFENGSYIFDNAGDNIIVRGYNATKRLTLINGNNSPGAILLDNLSGAIISYTTISGFDIFGGIILSDTRGSTISNNTITNNLDGINVQGSSLNNTISNNTISYNLDNGIKLEPGVIGQTISNNNINYNTNNGIFVNGSSNNVITNNTGINNNQYGIYFYNTVSNTGTSNIISGSVIGIFLEDSQNNVISNNKVNNNYMGIALDNSSNNTFTNNIINTNTLYGVTLQSLSSGNIFNGGSITGNTDINIFIDQSHYNQFISLNIEYSTIGIQLNSSNHNIFDGSNVTNNTSGILLSVSSNNTLNLTNNNNGIDLIGGSDNNSIYNNQAANTIPNNITISNGSNNTITGGLTAVNSTTSRSLFLYFINNTIPSPEYSVTGNELSGVYSHIDMTGLTGATIEFTTSNGTRNIVVTYNDNNTHYDSVSVSSSSSNNNGSVGGLSSLPTCTASQLVCTNDTRAIATSALCQSTLVGQSCTVQSGNLPVGSIIGSPFNNEMNNAYLWSYAHSITTMNTILKANMTGVLIRSHMAKMISNFAINIAGRVPNTGADCTFTDTANQTTEMKYYITLACQLGLMGQGITNFNPTSTVTRAQFGTIMSRVIWGDTYNTSTPYYARHLTALKNVGIMTQIDRPMDNELRGRVMIMMKRTYEGGYLTN